MTTQARQAHADLVGQLTARRDGLQTRAKTEADRLGRLMKEADQPPTPTQRQAIEDQGEVAVRMAQEALRVQGLLDRLHQPSDSSILRPTHLDLNRPRPSRKFWTTDPAAPAILPGFGPAEPFALTGGPGDGSADVPTWAALLALALVILGLIVVLSMTE